MRVLIAEQDTLVRRVLETAVTQWGYHATTCTEGTEAWQVLQGQNPPDFALLDVSLPGMDGARICSALKQAPAPATYTVLLTPPEQEPDPTARHEPGPDDYLTLPVDAGELRARLRIGERLVELREELAEARETIRVKTTLDSATGVWNRDAALDCLSRELTRSQREGAPLAIVLADLDDFKLINDTYGHAAGDMALREAAQRFRRVLRPYDGLGRYGGDEFLVILPGCDAEAANTLADRLRLALSSRPMTTERGGAFFVTLTAGVSSASHRNGIVGPDALTRAAETALVRAKQAASNRVATASNGSGLNVSA
jgi:diguanylate cyclase (GGDEF)-like protein